MTGNDFPSTDDVARELQSTRDEIEGHWTSIKRLARRESELFVTLDLLRGQDASLLGIERRGA